MTATTAKLDLIRVYSELGWKVLPIHYPYADGSCSCERPDCGSSIGKHPFERFVPHGLKDATSDMEVLERWWTAEPDMNIAVVTGSDSGVVVLDVDPRHDGDKSMDAIFRKYGPINPTPRTLTGSGGFHYWFRHPGGTVHNSAGRVGRGLDIRGDGGYVVVAPSWHVAGKQYQWDAGHSPYGVAAIALANLPSWIAEPEFTGTYVVDGPEPIPEYVPEGIRDTTMASFAGTLRARGLNEEELYDCLDVVNRRFDPPLSSSDLHRIARSYARYPAGTLDVPYEAAPRQNVVLEDFPVTYLTELLRTYGRQAAETYDTDPATVVCAMLAFASGAMGLWTTRLNPEWEESALLWVGLVGDPGMKKTPIIKAVGRPYVMWQKSEFQRYKLAYTQWLEDKQRLKRDQLGPAPTLSQRLYDDTTQEAIAPRLQDDPRGGMIDRDELTGFAASMNQYKTRGGADRSNWLSTWAGRHIVVNRKSEQHPIYIERPYVSLIGGIQPQRLGSLLADDGNDGFLDRFLFAVMEQGKANARHGSKMENPIALRWHNVIKRLLDNEMPMFMPFNRAADARWQYWSERHANERNNPELDPILRGFWAKAEGTAARLALIHQGIVGADEEGSDVEIEEGSVEAAWRLMQYFKSTTRKVYGDIEETDRDRRLERILVYIEAHKGVVTGRQLLTEGIAGIKSASEAEELLDELQDRGRGWVEKKNVTGGKRVTFRTGQRNEE